MSSPLDKCLACVYNADGTRNYRYAEDGTDLTRKPILNPNPLDIVVPPGRTISSIFVNWNNFYQFVTTDKKINTTDPIINSEKGRKDLTTQLIKEYNSNERWHLRFGYLKNNPLTQDDVRAIQTFTRITDPNVKVDGWLGTQTIQMYYPIGYIIETTTYAEEQWKLKYPNKPFPQSEISKLGPNSKLLYAPIKDSDFVPFIWGNKRYVIDYRTFVATSNSLNISDKDFAIPYDPLIHKSIIKRYTPTAWFSIESNTVVNQPASLINIGTQQIQNQKTTLQNITNLTNSFK
jgi:hypothetical protein